MRSTRQTIHGCRPTSVAIQPASSATTASGPATTANRRNQRLSSRSWPRQRASQKTTTASASSVPMPTIDWNARCVMLIGGSLASGIVSSPCTGFVNELREITDPSTGMSIANRTSPSISTPPSRSGDGLSVSVGELERRELGRLAGGRAGAPAGAR